MPIPSARGYVRVDAQHPQAGGVCQRCGYRYPLRDLVYQWEYAGAGLINTGFRVCSTCIDRPNEQLLTPRLPPDPLPVFNALPENYAQEEGGPPGPAQPQINPFTEDTMPFE